MAADKNVTLKLTLMRANAIRKAVETEVQLLQGLDPTVMSNEQKQRLFELEASLRTDF